MPTSDPARAEQERIRAAFGRIWPVHLSEFTKLMIALRAQFEGDLDLMLVLAVIGERTRPAEWAPDLQDPGRLTLDNGEVGRQAPINLQSVAAFSGIPRETVRRKVNRLAEKGWITRDPDGRLAITRAAGEDLEPATRQSIAYLAALAPHLAPGARG